MLAHLQINNPSCRASRRVAVTSHTLEENTPRASDTFTRLCSRVACMHRSSQQHRGTPPETKKITSITYNTLHTILPTVWLPFHCTPKSGPYNQINVAHTTRYGNATQQSARGKTMKAYQPPPGLYTRPTRFYAFCHPRSSDPSSLHARQQPRPQQ